MKFLARDPIPIFLGEAGMGHNCGGYSAQLGKFDVFYTMPPPIALSAEAPPEDGVANLVVEDLPQSGLFFVPGEIPLTDGVASFYTAAPEPELGLFDVVYEES